MNPDWVDEVSLAMLINHTSMGMHYVYGIPLSDRFPAVETLFCADAWYAGAFVGAMPVHHGGGPMDGSCQEENLSEVHTSLASENPSHHELKWFNFKMIPLQFLFSVSFTSITWVFIVLLLFIFL